MCRLFLFVWSPEILWNHFPTGHPFLLPSFDPIQVLYQMSADYPELTEFQTHKEVKFEAIDRENISLDPQAQGFMDSLMKYGSILICYLSGLSSF